MNQPKMWTRGGVGVKNPGNFADVLYVWSLKGDGDSGRVVQRGPLLTLSGARRSDSGAYTVTARNSYGDFATTVTVELDVRYPPA